MNQASIEPFAVQEHEQIAIWQMIPLMVAAALLTIGLAMFLSGTNNLSEVVQPVIVVFGGTLAAVLLTFPTNQLGLSLQLALARGIRGVTAPEEMVKAMLKLSDLSRREGLIGVADARSNNVHIESVCVLIGTAADESEVSREHARADANELRLHKLASDVFMFAAGFALAMGVVGSIGNAAFSGNEQALSNSVLLPLICGICLTILMLLLVGRLRAAHHRVNLTADIAYQGAIYILQDNNVQRLRNRLVALVPQGMRS